LPDTGAERAAIGVRLDGVTDLFEKYDPAPMPQGELAPEVAGYICNRAARVRDADRGDFSLRLDPDRKTEEVAVSAGKIDRLRGRLGLELTPAVDPS